MIMDDEAWQLVKNIPHVINFVGTEQQRDTRMGRGHVTPVPLSPTEVKRLLQLTQGQKPLVKVELSVGDQIKVLSGPFKDFEGEVIEVTPESKKLKALLSMFGRETPVELEFHQIENLSVTSGYSEATPNHTDE